MDAAVCLPVFVLAVGLLLLLMMQAGTEDTVVRASAAACQSSIEAVAGAKILDSEIAEPVLQAAFYAGRLHAYLDKEWEEGPRVFVSGYLPEQKTRLGANLQVDHLVRVNVSVRRKAAFSLAGTDGVNALRTFVFRPWKGESKQLFEDTGERVYVFPKYGERYHTYGCRIMKEGSVEAILTEKLKRQYKACKTCKPSSMPYGSLVFLFSDGSRVYHRRECPCITKYYVSIPKEEAVAEGYTPCLFCQGGS